MDHSTCGRAASPELQPRPACEPGVQRRCHVNDNPPHRKNSSQPRPRVSFRTQTGATGQHQGARGHVTDNSTDAPIAQPPDFPDPQRKMGPAKRPRKIDFAAPNFRTQPHLTPYGSPRTHQGSSLTLHASYRITASSFLRERFLNGRYKGSPNSTIDQLVRGCVCQKQSPSGLPLANREKNAFGRG